ncbi:MAG: flagellar biosynthesis protein FliQ [Alphaproteobacteria bacterium]|nr:flagellar biosynthesis protein FliQ [Alphaproteobacteria bacterium]
MNEAQVLSIVRDAILTMIMMSAPVLIAGMLVGVLISVFQTLTSIQEMTLVFVPKIIAVFIAILLLTPFLLTTITSFTEKMFDYIISMG